MGHTFDTLKAQVLSTLRAKPVAELVNLDHCIMVAFNRDFSTKLGLAFEEDEVALAKPNMETADGEAWWIVFSMRNGIFTWVPANVCERFEEKVYAFLFRPPADETEDPEYALLRNGMDTGIGVQVSGSTYVIAEETEDAILFHPGTYATRDAAFAAAEALHTRRVN